MAVPGNLRYPRRRSTYVRLVRQISATSSSSTHAILTGCLTSRRSEITAPLPHLARLFGVYCFGTTGVAVKPVSANGRRPPPRRWLDGQARSSHQIKLLRCRFCPLTRGMRQPFQYALPFLERAGESRPQSFPWRRVILCEQMKSKSIKCAAACLLSFSFSFSIAS